MLEACRKERIERDGRLSLAGPAMARKALKLIDFPFLTPLPDPRSWHAQPQSPLKRPGVVLSGTAALPVSLFFSPLPPPFLSLSLSLSVSRRARLLGSRRGKRKRRSQGQGEEEMHRQAAVAAGQRVRSSCLVCWTGWLVVWLLLSVASHTKEG